MTEKFVLLDFDEKYAISNKGTAKNVKTGRTLSKQINKQGYEMVQFTINGRKKNFRVHRLVAINFIPNGNNFPYVNHKDGNKQNNDVSNLEWCTAKMNDNHARMSGLKNENKPILATHLETGEKTSFESLSECARYHNCNKSYIHRVLKNTYGRTMYKGYTFEYIQE